MLWVTIALPSPLVATAAPSLSFSGNTLKAVEVTPERNTGLDKIYVLYDVKGVSFSVPVANINNARIYRYSNLGGAYAEEIKSVEKQGSQLVLDTFEGDLGYIIEDGDNRYYFWIVNTLRCDSRSAVSRRHRSRNVIIQSCRWRDPVHRYITTRSMASSACSTAKSG